MSARRRALAVLVACAALAAGCGDSGRRPATRPPASPDDVLFAVDRSQPLAVRDEGVVNSGRYPVRIHAVSFADGRGGRLDAFLAVPPGEGRRPGVVYVHGSGGSRLDLLAPATWLAGRRVVALVVDLPDLRAQSSSGGDPIDVVRRERDRTVADVVALRRALDVLAARPDVDPGRLGYVGVSAGARLGALLVGVDHRTKAAALVSGGAAPVQAYTRRAPAALRPRLRALLSTVDPLRLVRRAAPTALLFQNGLKDEVVPRGDLRRLAAAARRPKEVRWYPTGHRPDNRVWRQQLDWLAERLPVTGPPVRGSLTGPA